MTDKKEANANVHARLTNTYDILYSYDVLQALKDKEDMPPYAVFVEKASRISSLIQCYDSFHKQTLISKQFIDHGRPRMTTSAGGGYFRDNFVNVGGPPQCIGRALVVKFLLEIVDYYMEGREIVAVAMNYLDRFLLTRLQHDDENILIPPRVLGDDSNTSESYRSAEASKLLDIYAMVCLDIAIKLYSPTSGCPVRGAMKHLESQHRREHPQQFSSGKGKNLIAGGLIASKVISDTTVVYDGYKFTSITQIFEGKVSAMEVAYAEKFVISTLDYLLHPVTSHAIIREFFKLVTSGSNDNLSGMWCSIAEYSQFQVELGLINAEILGYPPSIQAAAALSNSVHRHTSEIISTMNGKDQESVLRQQEEINKIRGLLYRMEVALKISLQRDERIATLRRLFLDLLKSNDRYKTSATEVDASKDTAIFSPTSNQKERVNNKKIFRTPHDYQKSSDEETFWRDPYCYLSADFDELLFPRTEHTKTNAIDPAEKTDLINHYNNFIRPELYGKGINVDDDDFLTATCSLTDDSNSLSPLRTRGCNDRF